MKINRKLKKRIIKTFGRGTYRGLLGGHLQLRNLHKQGGVVTHRTYKHWPMPYPYTPGQHNPRLLFPNIN